GLALGLLYLQGAQPRSAPLPGDPGDQTLTRVRGGNAMEERCKCGHWRSQHVDHMNPLQIEPLAMTGADEGDRDTLSPIVYGAGRCMIEGCGCELFVDEEP